MAKRQPFDPNMHGGTQLNLGFEVPDQPQPPRCLECHRLTTYCRCPQTDPTGPTTVVCLKGRRGDPDIEDVVYVGRPMYRGGWTLKGHLLANPYTVDKDGTAEQVVAKYRIWLDKHQALVARELPKLRGRRLGCWCAKNAPCHARVLAELADAAEVTP